MSEEKNEGHDIVTNAILRYLGRKHTNYGIMLNGQWGSGKTYYWKHVLKKEVINANFHPIYVSANGLKSTEALSRKILMEMAKNKSAGLVSEKGKDVLESLLAIGKPILKLADSVCDTAKKAFGLTSDLLHLELKTESLLNILDFSESIICIDDVERYGGDPDELMGFCNDLIEHRGAHLIFIANEEKMEEKTKGNFRKIKEKVIGKTIQCNLDSKTIVEALLKQMGKGNPDAGAFLKEHLQLILDMMKRSGERNYRTVNMLIGDFQDVCEEIGKIEHLPLTETELETAKEALLKFLLAAGFEILAKGIPSKDIEELRTENLENLRIMLSAMGNKKQSEERYFPAFVRRYYGVYDRKTCRFFPSVIGLLTSGNIDRSELAKELRCFHEEEPTVPELVLSGNFREINDDVFEKEVKDRLLEDIENGEVSYMQYMRLFVRYVTFLQMGLMDIEVQDLKEKFLQGLEKIREAGQALSYHWTVEAFQSERVSMKNQLSVQAPEALSAYEEVAASVNQTASYKNQVEPDWFLRELERDFGNAMKLADPYIHQENVEKSLFSGTRPEELYHLLRQRPNKDIQAFRQLVEGRLYFGSTEGSKIDNRFLLELAALIRERIPEGGGRRLSEGILLELAEDIEKTRRRTPQQEDGENNPNDVPMPETNGASVHI